MKRWGVVAALVVICAVGCNSIVGNHAHSLAPAASGGAMAGAPGAGGQATGGGSGGSAPAEAGRGGAAGTGGLAGQPGAGGSTGGAAGQGVAGQGTGGQGTGGQGTGGQGTAGQGVAGQGGHAGDSMPPPRPIAPLSTGFVTSKKPTFRWALAAGTGARVQICSDRACSVPVQTFDAVGTSGIPQQELPGGLLFWRLFGLTNGVAGTSPSPVWEMWVAAVSAHVATAWGTMLDLNGDGFADVAVGDPGANGSTGAVYIFPGGPSGVASQPTTTLQGRDGTRAYFGCSVASAGDINGDGFADLIVGAYGAANQSGSVYVYLGHETGIATTPDFVLGDNIPLSQLGTAVSAAGDVNADGYGDVAIAAFRSTATQGSAFVFLGGANGFRTNQIITLQDPNAKGAYASAVTWAGDMNGDGYSDVVVGAPAMQASGSSPALGGSVSFFWGSATGVNPTPRTIAQQVYSGEIIYFAQSVAGVGDVDGDGYADVAVGAPRSGEGFGQVYVYKGDATMPATVDIGVEGGQLGEGLGAAVGAAGDLNGDGYADVIATGSSLFLLEGGPTGLGSVPVSSVPGRYKLVQGAGDIDGDGHPDVLAGMTGLVQIFPGGAGGIALAPKTTLMDPADAATYATTFASLGPLELHLHGQRLVWRPRAN